MARKDEDNRSLQVKAGGVRTVRCSYESLPCKESYAASHSSVTKLEVPFSRPPTECRRTSGNTEGENRHLGNPLSHVQESLPMAFSCTYIGRSLCYSLHNSAALPLLWYRFVSSRVVPHNEATLFITTCSPTQVPVRC